LYILLEPVIVCITFIVIIGKPDAMLGIHHTTRVAEKGQRTAGLKITLIRNIAAIGVGAGDISLIHKIIKEIVKRIALAVFHIGIHAAYENKYMLRYSI
jgi:hypothetical protein